MKLKANRRALYAACAQHVAASEPLDAHETAERTRGRTVRRLVETYPAPTTIPEGWPEVRHVVRVVRSGEREGKPYRREGLYLTSRTDGAAALAEAARLHWAVENRLHWSKDAEMNEDRGGVRSVAGASVLSLLRGIAVSVAHRAGLRSMTAARSRLANRVPEMLAILRT